MEETDEECDREIEKEKKIKTNEIQKLKNKSKNAYQITNLILDNIISSEHTNSLYHVEMFKIIFEKVFELGLRMP